MNTTVFDSQWFVERARRWTCWLKFRIVAGYLLFLFISCVEFDLIDKPWRGLLLVAALVILLVEQIHRFLTADATALRRSVVQLKFHTQPSDVNRSSACTRIITKVVFLTSFIPYLLCSVWWVTTRGVGGDRITAYAALLGLAILTIALIVAPRATIGPGMISISYFGRPWKMASVSIVDCSLTLNTQSGMLHVIDASSARISIDLAAMTRGDEFVKTMLLYVHAD